MGYIFKLLHQSQNVIIWIENMIQNRLSMTLRVLAGNNRILLSDEYLEYYSY